MKWIKEAIDKGLLLIGATIAAIILINSHTLVYHDLITTKIFFKFGSYHIHTEIQHFVNDFLMTIFFLIIGIEMKHEMTEGYLQNNKILPIICAIAGVIVPIVIYCLINFDDIRGLTIPSATDIAFTLAVISIFKNSVPKSIVVFVTALAVIDDLIAIILIAIFYNSNIDFYNLFYGFLGLCVLVFLIRAGISKIYLYYIISLVIWYFVFKSGIHATIVGVAVGFLLPKNINHINIAVITYKRFDNFAKYFILPMFAFCNSGIHITAFNILNPITIGIGLGLFLGKQLGIFTTAFLLIKTNIVKLPHKATFVDLYGASVFCGIGFTMSLFMTILSFEDEFSLNAAKIGLIIGSVLSIIWGSIIFYYKGHGQHKI